MDVGVRCCCLEGVFADENNMGSDLALMIEVDPSTINGFGLGVQAWAKGFDLDLCLCVGSSLGLDLVVHLRYRTFEVPGHNRIIRSGQNTAEIAQVREKNDDLRKIQN
uniref:Uncharacterized protein n=1 Tax=Romanomermis culicivorax TaxID=13658 RepID=A0A915I1W2_ROMCU